ncbi:NAD(P)/FAD-dependent oxidoreductase [Sphingomicrobium lutaoense]|uniref:D-arginine dehydrogenase n=1 Tax=Sphingomicrobium lutaoense TaxID=515949 RepID=A0A839YY61_9SPHN|nr:FAD-binding oxidoreductase [Sphingomicrobium lutaoense]MBB3763956.1 D-arginine dehydrogenase [Sphingomicrobium lutaoense]
MTAVSDLDAIIAGGGIAGASLGARLVAAGMTVVLLEREEHCGMHATGRSAAFWQASLGGDSPERRLSLASRPLFEQGWPGAEVPLLRTRGAIHLTGPCGEDFPATGSLEGADAPRRLSRAELDGKIEGLRDQWTGGWWEESCADIDVAAFHAACLKAFRQGGGQVVTDAELLEANRSEGSWIVRTSQGDYCAPLLVNAAGAWGDIIAARAGVEPLGLEPRRRSVVQLRIGKTGLRDTPFVTDLHESFYFKGEGDNSVWVCPLDQTPSQPCDSAPEELDIATAIDRFQNAIDWPVEAVERRWSGLRTFAPGDGMVFGFDDRAEGFFWCVGQGGMGIQTAPAYSLLCSALIRGEPLDPLLEGVTAADFKPRRSR